MRVAEILALAVNPDVLLIDLSVSDEVRLLSLVPVLHGASSIKSGEAL